MIFLKTLRLRNFCNYKECTLDFTRDDGTPYPLVCFYGPNGIGKSTVLEAIGLLSGDQTGRPEQYVRNSLKKYVRNMDYDPSYQRLHGYEYDSDWIVGKEKQDSEMLVEGTYSFNGKDIVVSVNQNGWDRNDLLDIQDLSLRRRLVYAIKTDSDLSLNSFQLHSSYKTSFEDIVSTITRYKTECIKGTHLTGTSSDDFYTDVVLVKNNHRIHFKRMSAGERKICKSFSDILNLMHSLENPRKGEAPMPGWPRILLMDNITMHVYYDRHVTMIESLKNVFNKQQIFATTHSGTLIDRYIKGENDSKNELWINLEAINN